MDMTTFDAVIIGDFILPVLLNIMFGSGKLKQRILRGIAATLLGLIILVGLWRFMGWKSTILEKYIGEGQREDNFKTDTAFTNAYYEVEETNMTDASMSASMVQNAGSVRQFYGELKANATASSYFRRNSTYVGPENVIDKDDHTSWDSDSGKFKNQYVELSTNGEKCAIEGFVIQNGKAPGYQRSDKENTAYYYKNARVNGCSIEIDGKEVWRGTLVDTNKPQTINFGKTYVGSIIRLNIISIHDYGVSSDCGVCITAFEPF